MCGCWGGGWKRRLKDSQLLLFPWTVCSILEYQASRTFTYVNRSTDQKISHSSYFPPEATGSRPIHKEMTRAPSNSFPVFLLRCGLTHSPQGHLCDVQDGCYSCGFSALQWVARERNSRRFPSAHWKKQVEQGKKKTGSYSFPFSTLPLTTDYVLCACFSDK